MRSKSEEGVKLEEAGKFTNSGVEKLIEKLVFLAVCFFPFQVALTIKLGDLPLKISEILLIVSFILLPFSGWFFRRSRGQGVLLCFAFVFIVSFFAAFLAMRMSIIDFARGFDRSQSADIVFYFAFTVFSLMAWKTISGIERGKFEKALLIAGWLTVLAVLFQYVGVSTGNQSLIESFGFESEGRVENRTVSTRNGPFKEGQHLGFVAGALLLVAIGRKKVLLSFGLLFCIYYSQSTTAILGIFAALFILIIFNLNFATIIGLLTAGAALIVGFIFNPAVREYFVYQLSKLGLASSDQGDTTISMDVRGIKADIGWDIMLDHPILGVGPGRYSIWFFDYPQTAQLPKYYFHSDHRAIAENIYAQVGAEVGLTGLILFIFFLLLLLVKALARKEILVATVCSFIIIGLTTQSTLTFLPIWALLAYVASEKSYAVKKLENEKN